MIMLELNRKVDKWYQNKTVSKSKFFNLKGKINVLMISSVPDLSGALKIACKKTRPGVEVNKPETVIG